MESGHFAEHHNPSVFVFNPFVEGYIARGKGFAPVKHQAMLAADLANLPQFLCEPNDVVLVAKRPSASFLKTLKQAGFLLPEFVELKAGRIDPSSSLCRRQLRSLRPWAWGPDSVELLKPLFPQLAGETRNASQYFNDAIAQLYSKAWSADFLRAILARLSRGLQRNLECDSNRRDATDAEKEARSESLRPSRLCGFIGGTSWTARDFAEAESWLCSTQEAGVAVATLEDALEAIAAIRSRGHQRVIVKQAYGSAGHNALRLWEREVSPAQQHWLTQALSNRHQLVVEPWLERQLDFSVQLEMGRHSLKLCGYTGLINDLKGQFLANRAEPDYSHALPAQIAALLHLKPDILERFYREVFAMLEKELQRAGYIGPVGIDAFVYRTSESICRLKPVVEINPRYTIGRLTVELMRHAGPGTIGVFRLVSHRQARAEGYADFASYVRFLSERDPVHLETDGKIRQGILCLNDPAQAQACLATFRVIHAD